MRHLHAFAREVELTHDEWQAGIRFLTEAGRLSTDSRQELILLSDVLGLSMLVDAIANRKPAGATASTVLGPFHVADAPARELGDDIAGTRQGERCLVTGRVVSVDGTPLAGARVDVWQADHEGFYDVQRSADLRELRAVFRADHNGFFWFRTIVPAPYPIPDDGPVGRLLRAAGRHPNRPAHIHFIAAAEGHEPVTTHAFVAGSPYLDSDAVFGVKESLIVDFSRIDDPEQGRAHGMAVPYRHCDFEIRLQPSGATATFPA